MLELRKAPLPHDLLHLVDRATENRHLTGGAHIALTAYGDTKIIDDIANRSYGKRGWLNTAAACIELEKYGHTILADVHDTVREAALAASTLSLVKGVADYSQHVCWQSFEDACWGGCLYPFKRVPKVDGLGRVGPRLNRRLHTDGWVKRAIRVHANESGHYHYNSLWEINGRKLHEVTEEGKEILRTTMTDLMIRQNEQYAELTGAIYERQRHEKIRLKRKYRKKVRRVINRSVTTAQSVLGQELVNDFIKHKPVTIETGTDISVVAKLQGSVGSFGHGSLTVQLVGPNFRTGLCIYQELPAMDQLASLALHARSGCIADVIEKGNLYSTEPAALEHPMLIGKKNPNIPEVLEPGQAGGALELFDGWRGRQRFIRKYESEMGERFVQRLFLEIFGRTHKQAYEIHCTHNEREQNG